MTATPISNTAVLEASLCTVIRFRCSRDLELFKGEDQGVVPITRDLAAFIYPRRISGRRRLDLQPGR